MHEKDGLANLRPLFFGRLSRMVAGMATLAVIFFLDYAGEDLIVSLALLVLGLSFVIGGSMANPGCEITALLNLALPSRKRLHVI